MSIPVRMYLPKNFIPVYKVCQHPDSFEFSDFSPHYPKRGFSRTIDLNEELISGNTGKLCIK
jgi:hypothetical protein